MVIIVINIFLTELMSFNMIDRVGASWFSRRKSDAIQNGRIRKCFRIMLLTLSCDWLIVDFSFPWNLPLLLYVDVYNLEIGDLEIRKYIIYGQMVVSRIKILRGRTVDRGKSTCSETLCLRSILDQGVWRIGPLVTCLP